VRDSEATELRSIVSRYPKLTFRIIVGLCVVLLSVGGWFLKYSYGRFELAAERSAVIEQKYIDLDQTVTGLRDDVKEIRDDVKEILRSQRRTSFSLPASPREVLREAPACGDGRPAKLTASGFWSCSATR